MSNKTQPDAERPTDMDIHLWIETADSGAIDRLHAWTCDALDRKPEHEPDEFEYRLAYLIDAFEHAWEGEHKPCKAAFEWYMMLRVMESCWRCEGWPMEFLDSLREER